MFGLLNRKRKAFTLIEFTVAFGSAALVMAGVWVAASTVVQSSKQQKTNEQVMMVVQNIRDHYSLRSGSLPENEGGSIDGELVKENLIPEEMKTDKKVGSTFLLTHALATGTVSASQGAFSIEATGTNRNAMRVKMRNMKQESCIKFLTRLPFQDSRMGIIGISKGNSEIETIDAKKLAEQDMETLPNSPKVAEEYCRYPENNEVHVVFSLRN